MTTVYNQFLITNKINNNKYFRITNFKIKFITKYENILHKIVQYEIINICAIKQNTS